MEKSKIVSFNPPPKERIISILSQRIDPSTFEVKTYQKKPTEEEACEAVKDAALIITYPGGPHITRKILEAARGVKLIQFFSRIR